MSSKSKIEQFLSDPDELLDSSFDNWNTESFVEASNILENLLKMDQSLLVSKLSTKMLKYMKYCFDNHKYFPWKSTFPSTPEKTSIEQFIDYYNAQVSTLPL